eukprot:scaffold282616_cov18-Tisochrysis_lutea.AAC.1
MLTRDVKAKRITRNFLSCDGWPQLVVVHAPLTIGMSLCACGAVAEEACRGVSIPPSGAVLVDAYSLPEEQRWPCWSMLMFNLSDTPDTNCKVTPYLQQLFEQ